MQFSKRNKQTPLLPLPEINSIYHAESEGSRDQPQPGYFLIKRKEPGDEVALVHVVGLYTGWGLYSGGVGELIVGGLRYLRIMFCTIILYLMRGKNNIYNFKNNIYNLQLLLITSTKVFFHMSLILRTTCMFHNIIS